jgi:hypothetical protein
MGDSPATGILESKKKALMREHQGGEALEESLDLRDFLSLKALGTLDNGEFHLLSFLESPISISLNGGVMDENISTGIPLNKSVPLGIVEPLDFPSLSHACRDPFQSIKILSYMFLSLEEASKPKFAMTVS